MDGVSLASMVSALHSNIEVLTVTVPSLTMDVEVVMHAVNWQVSKSDTKTTHAIILTGSMDLSLIQ